MNHVPDLKKIGQLKYQKMQMMRRLKQECQDIDKVAKYKRDLIDEQRQLIHDQIINTRQSRVDASVIYLGVVPGVTVAPSVKPLPMDKDYIPNVVQARHKRLKKIEKVKMRNLLDRIEGDLENWFPELELHRASPFIIPDKTFIQEEVKSSQAERSSRSRLAEIVNLVDNNRIRNRRNKFNRKHLGESMSTNLLPEITDQATARADDLLKGQRSTESKFTDKFKNQLTRARLGPIKDKSRLTLLPVEDDEFSRLYKECGKSRYLRRIKSPLEKIPDITRVF